MVSTQRTQREPAMTQVTHPSKQAVRDFMAKRQVERVPPPRPEEVRRQLGWNLVEAERENANGSKR